MIEIRPVVSSKELRLFLDLPSKIYASYSEYTPPLRMDRRMLLDPNKGTFFENGVAKYWLAWREEVPIGRISAQISDPGAQISAHTGHFGCLDSIDDLETVQLLTKQAELWLLEQGCTAVLGPFSLNINGEPGLLIEGANQPMMTRLPWHPPYLGPLLEACGYGKAKDLQSWIFLPNEVDLPGMRTSLSVADRRSDLTVRPITRRSLKRDIPLLAELYNDGWQETWGFVPLNQSDLSGAASHLSLLMPNAVGSVISLKGRPAAALFVIPNSYELTRGLKPVPSLLEWLRLGFRTLTFKPHSLRIAIMGIASEHRHSAAGAMLLLSLLHELIRLQDHWHVERAEGGWVLEDNQAITRVLSRYHFSKIKTLRLYTKHIQCS